jgi:hypothetical protein
MYGLTRLDGTIKDLGLSNVIANQLSARAPLANPQFQGSVLTPLLNATAITIMNNVVATAVQISKHINKLFDIVGGIVPLPD